MKLRHERLGRLKFVTDAPREISLDAGRTVVMAFGAVGEPVVGGRAVWDVAKREQRDKVPSAGGFPDIGGSIAAAADDELAVGRERDGLRAFEISEKLAQQLAGANVPELDRLAAGCDDRAVGGEGHR